MGILAQAIKNVPPFDAEYLVNEIEKDWFKCLEMKELNDTEKFTAQVLFKFRYFHLIK